MRTTLNPQQGLLDSLMPTPPANQFLEQIDALVDWQPVEQALHKRYPAMRGHSQHPPVVLFKMFFLQHCYNLSAAQCAEQVRDRLSWRAFVGLGWQDPVPDAPALVRFRQRLREIESVLKDQLIGRRGRRPSLTISRITWEGRRPRRPIDVHKENICAVALRA